MIFMIDYIKQLEEEQSKKEGNKFEPGDTIEVHHKIIEGTRKRVQIFKGIVIAKKQVEKVFQMHSPNIVKVVVLKRGKTRRAKLYYLRDRVGKSSTVKEKR